MIGFMMMKNGCVINKTWIILDILSIDSVTNNLDYVEDVKNCVKHKELTVLTNGVSLICDRKLRLTFLTLSVHVNKNYLSTILSFKDLKKHSSSANKNGYIDREGYECDSEVWNDFRFQGMSIGVILF